MVRIKKVKRYSSLYLMFLPAAILLFLFNYLPMFGVIIAFKRFNFRDGFIGSPWAEPFFKNFEFLFASKSAWTAMANTLILNFLFLLTGIIFQVGLAILFNEIYRKKTLKKVMQTGIFLPYFISWVVVGVIAYNLFNYSNGVLNSIIIFLGGEAIDWYAKPKLWIFILVLFSVWKSTGYGMILYSATLTSVDSSLYEAARIDGANRVQQIRYISIPMLKPLILTMFLLNCGKIMNSDFGMIFSLIGNNAQLYSTADVLDTFIYRTMRTIGDIGMSSAASFFQSVCSFILLVVMNTVVRKMDNESSLF